MEVLPFVIGSDGCLGGLDWTDVAKGTDIWAYGMSGPSQGYYTAILNNKTVGQYTAQADDVDYNYLLFAAHDLPDGQTHYLTLMNSEQSTSLAFDMAMIKTSEDVNM